jgi:hypothetical protein
MYTHVLMRTHSQIRERERERETEIHQENTEKQI